MSGFLSKRNNNRYLLISPDYPPPYSGGSLVYVHTLVENSGYNFDILTSPLSNKSLAEVTSDRHRVIRKYFLSNSYQPRRLKLILMYLYLALYVPIWCKYKKYKTVVLNPGLIGNSILILMLKILKVENVTLAYAEEITTAIYGNSLKHKIKQFMLNKCYPMSDGFIVVCDFAKDLLVDVGVDQQRISIIPPTFNKNKYSNVSEVVNGASDAPLVLSVGRIIKRKGFDNLLESISILKNEFPNIKCVIVGDGPDMPNLVTNVLALKLEHHVELKGWVTDDELNALYKKSTVFVLANRMLPNGDCEGSPVVLTEASSHGLPVVAGKTGGASTAVENNHTGFLVDPENVSELSSAISRLLSDSELRIEFGKNGQEKVKNDHDPELAGKKFSDFISRNAEAINY